MKFRTEVSIPGSTVKIAPHHRIFSIGSCFASEMEALLNRAQLQTCSNPFGTLFNPFSVNTAVKRIHSADAYEEEELISYGGQVISLDHHSSFNSKYAHQTLQKINGQIESSNQFLRGTDWMIITYGTSFIYDFLPRNRPVANCHKIPGKFFRKRLLSHLELTDSVYETLSLLRDIALPGVQIVLTVSPVRHTKDGMTENTLSKAKLITAIHEILPQFENCHYLPAYEILMDDLRDYRFYKDDLIHPSPQAIRYIWEKFGEAYFSEEMKDFVTENFKLVKAAEHRPADPQDPAYADFKQNLKEKMAAQQAKVKHRIFEGWC